MITGRHECADFLKKMAKIMGDVHIDVSLLLGKVDDFEASLENELMDAEARGEKSIKLRIALFGE